MTGFRLHTPMWLWLLIPLLLLAVWAVGRQRSVAILYSEVALLKSLPVTMALRVKRGLPATDTRTHWSRSRRFT